MRIDLLITPSLVSHERISAKISQSDTLIDASNPFALAAELQFPVGRRKNERKLHLCLKLNQTPIERPEAGKV